MTKETSIHQNSSNSSNSSNLSNSSNSSIHENFQKNLMLKQQFKLTINLYSFFPSKKIINN